MTAEKSTTYKNLKANLPNELKKDFDAVEFMKEERRKLIAKLDKSGDDRIVFKKRVKKLRKNAKHEDINYRGSR